MRRILVAVGYLLYLCLYGLITLFELFKLIEQQWKKFLKGFWKKKACLSTNKVSHVGIVRQEQNFDELDCLKITRLVLWSVVSGIETLTIVDTKVANWEPWVEKIVCWLQSKDPYQEATIWCNSNEDFSPQFLSCSFKKKSPQFCKLEVHWKNKGALILNLFRSREARQSLIKSIIKLSSEHMSIYQKLPETCKKEYITNFLNEGANGTLLGSEPEVVIIFGDLPCLTGFPVWEVRLSQIFFKSSFSQFTFDDLKMFLDKNACTPKRFGT